LITALTDLNMADFAHFDVKSKRPKGLMCRTEKVTREGGNLEERGFMVRLHDWRTVSTHLKGGTFRNCVVTQAIQSTFRVLLMRLTMSKASLRTWLVVSIYNSIYI
jgi:hypothetical protein